MKINRFRLTAPLSVTALVFLLCAGADANAAQKAPSKPVTRAQAITQVDGITDRVVDKIWERTDYYWHDGDYNRIVGLIRVAVEADPAFLEAYASGAWLLWSMGQTPAADDLLKLGVARNPRRYELNYEFGWHLFNTKRYTEALPHLRAASRFANAPSQVWKTLAHCYDRLGRTDESLNAWRTVVRRFPRDSAGPPNLRRVEQKKRGGGGGDGGGVRREG